MRAGSEREGEMARRNGPKIAEILDVNGEYHFVKQLIF